MIQFIELNNAFCNCCCNFIVHFTRMVVKTNKNSEYKIYAEGKTDFYDYVHKINGGLWRLWGCAKSQQL